jgi:ABC-type glycerol-3-phosphate transport system substrate-binding protein
MRRFIHWMLFAALLITNIAISPLPSQAQDAVILTLAVPNFNRDVFGDSLFADFTAAHPGVTVKIVPNNATISDPVDGLDAHFTSVQAYAQSADVLFMDARRVAITPEATSAGYFLDLAPLVSGDTTLNADDFFPTVWQSYQWNKGVWGLPTATDVLLMSYDPTAFDNAGLAYPSEKWTLEDVVNAANKLTVKEANGTVLTPGLSVQPTDASAILFQSLMTDRLYDPNSIPNVPKLDKPDVQAMLTSWAQLVTDGAVGNSQDSPLTISSVTNYIRSLRQNAKRAATLLPGGKAGLTVQGFAVSAGTQRPELAYALAAYLTTRPELSTRFSVMPARKSMVGVQATGGGQGGGPGGPGGIRNQITPEAQALIDLAVANGLSESDLRYNDYLANALQKMSADGIDAKAALQAEEALAVQNQAAAVEKKSTVTVVVTPPAPVTELAPGKVAIKFNMSSPVTPLPNQEKWDKLIADFTASDPQVGRVELDSAPRFGQITNLTDTYDCFYLPYNAIPSADLGVLLNIDPFLSADSSFDKSDVIGDSLTQMQRDNKTWGLPIVIQPAILKYNSTQFDKAAVPNPGANWTIDAFKDAVQRLKTDPADPPIFVAGNTNGEHLLMIMVAYGGLPLDNRTTPPTINFTDPKVVDAVRQTLDLAKQGYIKYNALATFDFNGPREQTAPIYSETLNGFSFRGNRGFNPNADTATTTDVYKSTNYPRGTNSAAISYSIGGAYVSAKSQNPEGCYRFISELSKHPDLFTAMPARRSLINDPQLSASQGADTTALYNEIDKLMQDPNTISIQSGNFGGGGNPTGLLVQRWLYSAFDNYVLNEADLDTELKQAESYAKAFQECTALIPPFDAATQNRQEYNRKYRDCAVKVDPSLSGLFGN